MIEDLESLLPVKFWQILFSCFREVDNVSANQRPVHPSCFSNRHEKHKLGRGRSCFLLNFLRSRKCISKSEARAPSCFFFLISPKNTILLMTLSSYFLSSFVISHSAVSDKSQMSQQLRGLGGHLDFPNCRKTQSW